MDGISPSSSDTCGAMAQAELIIPTLAGNQEGKMEKKLEMRGQKLLGWSGFMCGFPNPSLLCSVLYNISPRINRLLLLPAATIYHKDRARVRSIAFSVLILTHFPFLSLPVLL